MDHSFLPADRVFAHIEKQLRKRENIMYPSEYIDAVSQHSNNMSNLRLEKHVKRHFLNPNPNHTVKKIECRNHLLRNMCNKLRAITKETKYPLAYRKLLSEIKIMTIRKVVIASIQKYKSEKEKPEAVTSFRNEVRNSIFFRWS